MVDIHCHILPGIDDGPQDIEESIEMANIASLDGITTIVATPHIYETPTPEGSIRERVHLLNSRLTEQNIPVKILYGADVSAMLDVGLLQAYTIHQTRYILIEFPHAFLPHNSRDIVFRMRMKGYRPIMTHPERNMSVINDPRLLFDLLDTGVLVQVTADSLTGTFGVDIQECACYFLKRGAVDFIATDAHSSNYRRPVLSKAVEVAGRIIGKDRALDLVTVNPEMMLTGKYPGDTP